MFVSVSVGYEVNWFEIEQHWGILKTYLSFYARPDGVGYTCNSYMNKGICVS